MISNNKGRRITGRLMKNSPAVNHKRAHLMVSGTDSTDRASLSVSHLTSSTSTNLSLPLSPILSLFDDHFSPLLVTPILELSGATLLTHRHVGLEIAPTSSTFLTPPPLQRSLPPDSDRASRAVALNLREALEASKDQMNIRERRGASTRGNLSCEIPSQL